LGASLLLLGLTCQTQAATRTWDGGGADKYWTNRFNWVGDIAPVAGDDLAFPPVASAGWRATNNFPSGTAFGGILLTGTNYFLAGNAVRLSAGVSSQCPSGASNTVALAITLDAAQTFEQISSAAQLFLSGDINLNGNVLNLLGNAGYLRLGGAISGTGQIRKTGNATVELYGSGANTYSGGFTVLGGTLRLNKSVLNGAIPGPLTNAGLTYLVLDQNNQIANSAPVVLGRGSGFYLLDHSDYIGALFLTGAEVDTGTGTLSLNGDCTTEASDLTSLIAGNLRLNKVPLVFAVADGSASPDLNLTATIVSGVDVVKRGAGDLDFRNANAHAGTTTVNEGRLYLYHGQALGTTDGGTVVNSNANLFVVGVHVGAEPLTLNVRLPAAAMYAYGNSSWSGPVTLGTNVSLHSEGTMTFSNALSGPGSLRLTGQTFEFAGNVTNTYAGDTTVMCRELRLNHASSGFAHAIPADLIVGGGSADSNVVRLLQCCQMPNSTDVTVLTNGVLNLNGYGESLGGLVFEGGRVDTGGGLLTLNNDVQILASQRTAELTGRVSLGTGTRTFLAERNETTAYPTALISAELSGGGGIVWRGFGHPALLPTVMLYGGANSYAGLTTVSNLALLVDNPSSLGSTSSGTVLQYRGALSLVETAITNETVTLHYGSQLGSAGTSRWVGPVVLEGDALFYTPYFADFEIRGLISGPGGVELISYGVIRFAGSERNSYSGQTVIASGVLELAKTGVANGAIPGPLVLGLPGGYATTTRLLAVNQIANDAPVTINQGSLLDLNGYLDAIGPLTLNGGRAISGAGGTLRLLGDVTVGNPDAPSVIEGLLDLWDPRRSFTVASNAFLDIHASVVGSSDLVKLGAGQVDLFGSNTYTGLTLVGEGFLTPLHPLALGSTNAGTIVSNRATLYLNTSVTNEALVLNGYGMPGNGALLAGVATNVWTGPITLNADSDIYVASGARRLDLLGAIQGPGGLIKAGTGTLRLGGSSANTYAGTTRLNAGTIELGKTALYGGIPGELILGDGLGGSGADVVRLLAADQIHWTAPVTLASSGLLDLAGFNESVGSVSGSGQITLGAGRLSTGGNNASTVYSGLITGAGGRLTKNGTGTLTLTANNTYSGLTTVQEGFLLVSGAQPASAVQVNVFGTLLGTGTVGHLTNYGILAPGASPGGLFASNVVIKSGAGVLAVELQGPASDQHDRVHARGLVDVTGGKLWLDISRPPTDGDQFTIVNNLGASPVVGTFTGLPEGALLTTNGLAFRLSYLGGDGNDITLTFTNTALRLAGWELSGGNGNGVIDPNECNQLNLALSNRSSTAITGLSAELIPISPGVLVTCPAAAYGDLPVGGVATNRVPFQFSTLPGLIRGTDLQFLLAVRSAAHGAFNLPLTLPSGLAGADGGGLCESCPDRTIVGTLSLLSASHANAMIRSGTASSCAAPKTCPLALLAPARRYQTIPFVNGESNACVTVTLTADQPLFSAAYSPAFEPASLCAGYLGDLGGAVSNHLSGSYSFWVPARARFEVVVEENVPGAGGTFTLDVRGGSCRPLLGIRPAGPDRVVLDWTTAALGWQLVQTNQLVNAPHPPWPPVDGQPVVVGSRWQLTNSIGGATNRFYQLRAP
jgi:autotransporter-associated beta strand protein